MNKFIGYFQIGIAVLLYLVSVATFIDYLYSLTILDTVTAIENAFGTLVILIFMLVLAKFTLGWGKKRLQENPESESSATSSPDATQLSSEEENTGHQTPIEADQKEVKKEADN